MNTQESPHCTARVVVRDQADGRWLEFVSPQRIMSTCRVDEVRPLLREIEEAVERHGMWAAGFIAYEAAPAFDASLRVRTDGAFPLLWFGVFERGREIVLPEDSRRAGEGLAWRPSVTLAAYDHALAVIRAHIREGDTYQVNFTYRLRAQQAIDPWALFLRLAGGGDAPFAAFVDTGEWAVCSASPELFLRVDGERIESRPMKGTAARGLWFEDDQAHKAALLDSEKERAENVMIVDMVRNDLGRVAEPGRVEVPALFTAEAYPAVWQLTSTVTARTRAPLDQILASAFPPASITGAPKGRAMAIIAELEADPRRIYTGTIGWLRPGRHSQWNVAIRTVLVHKPSQTVEYGVGGGIVWDSTTAGEYGESEAKAKTLNPVTRTFDLLETLLWTPRDGYALWDAHMSRLARSGAFFGFALDLRKIREALARVAAGLPPQACRVRLQVSRLGAARCESVALDAGSLSFKDVALAAGPVDRRDIFLYHKTSVRSVYETALRQRPGCSDVLLFNEAGEVTETTVANVAVEIGGVRYTPPVRCGLLPGTQRAVLLDRGELRERVIRIEELREHPRVFLLNSVRGLHAVSVKSERA